MSLPSKGTEIVLIKGDCLKMMGKTPPNSVDLILTDPPYNIGKFMKDRATNLARMRENFFGDAGWDNLPYEEWSKNMEMFFDECGRVLKEGGSILIFMSLIRVESLISLAEKRGFYYKTTGVWHKTNPMPRNMNLHFINSVEGWVYFTKVTKTGTFNNGSTAIHDFIESSVAPSGEKRYGGHPTQKPEKVFQHFIEILSNRGDVVMDPFMGSGTAGVVAKKTGRSFIGIELSDNYFDVALKRIGSIHADSSCQENIIRENEDGETNGNH